LNFLKKDPKPYLEVLSKNNKKKKRETNVGGSPKKIEKQRTTQHWPQLPSCCVCKRVENFHITLTPKFTENLAGVGGGGAFRVYGALLMWTRHVVGGATHVRVLVFFQLSYCIVVVLVSILSNTTPSGSDKNQPPCI
jgi:hypothetical protein